MPSRRRQKAVRNRSRPVRMVAPCASPRHSRRRNHPLPQRTRSQVGRSMRRTQCHRNAIGGLTVPTPQFRERISAGFAFEDGLRTSRVT